ncbi:MAG: hypothetical protein QXE05_04185 [Nitrososphaeria archaeon]
MKDRQRKRVRREKGELQKEILRLLYRASPRGFSELKKLVDSRSTYAIQYALKALKNKGYVQQDDNGYSITPEGCGFLLKYPVPLDFMYDEPHYKNLLNTFIKKVENANNLEDLKAAILNEREGLVRLLREALRWRPI